MIKYTKYELNIYFSKHYLPNVNLILQLYHQFFYKTIILFINVSMRITDNFSITNLVSTRCMNMSMNPIHWLIFYNKIFQI